MHNLDLLKDVDMGKLPKCIHSGSTRLIFGLLNLLKVCICLLINHISVFFVVLCANSFFLHNLSPFLLKLNKTANRLYKSDT